MPVKTISLAKFQELNDQSENLTLIDVRTPEEVTEGYIEGSINIPVSIIDVKIGDYIKNKDQKIITYCRSGGRSSVAAKLLTDLGYSDVYSLEGGYLGYTAT